MAAISASKPAFKVADSGRSRHKPQPRLDKSPWSNPWEPWFAWRPKRVNGRWYWREWIYRRRIFSPGGPQWIYGDDFDVMRNK